MNIHPILVHFPIALLTVYTALEVLRFPVLKKQQWWFPIKTFLLLVGVVGGYFAILTGEMAEGAYSGTSTMQVVKLHSTFAEITIYLYAFLALCYLIEWGRRAHLESRLPTFLHSPWNVATRIEIVVAKAPVLILGSLIGFTLLSIVGALGGAIVYGPDIDPIVSLVYYFFFPK
jgi:uncharacterized membrane protein